MVNAQEWLDKNYLTEKRKENISNLNVKEQTRYLEGHLKIKGFNNLKSFDCSKNKLSQVEIAGCPILEKVDCSDNGLVELKLENLASLTELVCEDNQLTTLTIQNCPNLQVIHCSKNKLNELDFKDCSNLKEIYCSENQLTSVNIFDCSELVSLYCKGNQLTNLEISGLSKLKEIHCSNNKITRLILEGHINLEEVKCDKNQLTELKCGELTKLVSLECQNNQLTELEIKECPELEKVHCDDNKLTKLSLDKLESLLDLDCSKNQLNSLDISECPVLERLNCSNNFLTILDLNYGANLKELSISNNKFQDQVLNFLSCLTKLERLDLKCNDFVGSLRPLGRIPNLQILDISYTNIENEWEYLSDTLREFYCSSEKEKKQRVEEIESRLRGKFLAKKDYLTCRVRSDGTAHMCDNIDNKLSSWWILSSIGDKNRYLNNEYSVYPSYEYEHHYPSGGNFATLLQKWKKENSHQVKVAKLTKLSEEKEIRGLHDEIVMEREEAAKALEKAKEWRERQLKEITEQKGNEIKQLQNKIVELEKQLKAQIQISPK